MIEMEKPIIEVEKLDIVVTHSDIVDDWFLKKTWWK